MQSAHSFAHLVNDIVARYPQKRFIFRPHPVSGAAFWSKHLRESRNLTVLYHSSYEAWLFASQGLIHSGCTIGIQSELYSLPSIDVKNLFNDQRKRGLSSDLASHKPTTLVELDSIINSPPSNFKRNKDHLSFKYAKGLSEGSLEKSLHSNLDFLNPDVLDSLSQYYKITIPLKSNFQLVLDDLNDFSNSFRIKYHSDYLINQLNSILGTKPPLSSKSRYYSASEILNKVKRICGLLNVKARFKHYPSSNCFLFLPN